MALPYADGPASDPTTTEIWDHGEGFRPGAPDGNSGGWHGLDDGLGVEPVNVVSYHDEALAAGLPYPPAWHTMTFEHATHPADGVVMRRFVGCLRPDDGLGNALPLPEHPDFPGSGVPWVDSAAFELFAPAGQPAPGQAIVLVVGLFPTLGFPRDFDETSYYRPQTYLGYFSPDGLIRDHYTLTGAVGSDLDLFKANTAYQGAAKPIRAAAVFATASSQGIISNPPLLPEPYVISGYIVPQSMGRPTELIHQRSLQLLEAIRCILQDTAKTPLSGPLNSQQLDQVTVVFEGGSNGFNQAHWAGQLYPHRIHGVFGAVNHPSVQRQIGEQELAYLTSAFGGFGPLGSGYVLSDGRNWNQFAWNRGLQIHDLSFLRNFQSGLTYRPLAVFLGDEDVTATGTDWVSLFQTPRQPFWELATAPSGWSDAGFAWMVAALRCHEGGPIYDVYRMLNTPYEYEAIHGLIDRAVQNRQAELAGGQPGPIPTYSVGGTTQALTTDPSLANVDNAMDWWLARDGQSTPALPLTGPLQRDDQFFANSQPGAAGTWLGYLDSMKVHNGAVYVGGTEGVISRFVIDDNQPQRPLVRTHQSRPLGVRAWAMAAHDSSIYVGTHRHVHRLAAQTLQVTASRSLPWDEGRPQRMNVADVLPSHGGEELFFAAWQGGVVFLDPGDLDLLLHFREPGVQDVVPGLAPNSITLLSERGVVATVQFDASNQPTLLSSSDPQEGAPVDLERVRLNLMGSVVPAYATLFRGDQQGTSFRLFDPGNGQLVTSIPNITVPRGSEPGLGFVLDLAAVRVDSQTDLGDHVLILANDALLLFDESANLVGRKVLTVLDVPTPPPPPLYHAHTMGVLACSVAVGELSGQGDATMYSEEIVVATKCGSLLWLKVTDLLDPSGRLDDGVYELSFGAGGTTTAQPRTNASLSATWPIELSPNDDLLHVLDQSGNLWTVDASGNTELQWADWIVVSDGGLRQMRHVDGLPTGRSLPNLSNSIFATAWGSSASPTTPSAYFDMDVWAPRNTKAAFLEKLLPNHAPPNWTRRRPFGRAVSEFLVFDHCGDVRDAGGGRFEAYWWSSAPAVEQGNPPPPGGAYWPNLVQGMTVTGNTIDGMWASSGVPASVANQVGSDVDWLDFRSVDAPHYMDQQALEIVNVHDDTVNPPTDTTYLVLGCPGGRVRVIAPGAMRTMDPPGNEHALGGEVAVSDDFGHGITALDVAPDPAVPGQYLIAAGTLLDHTVGVNYLDTSTPPAPVRPSVRMLTWTPGQPLTVQQTLDLAAVAPRSAFGVTGLAIADLLPGTPGPELVVTTMSGDLLLLDRQLNVLQSTHVPGALGCYGSIRVADLDLDGKPEVYVGGSFGLHKFYVP